MKDEAHDVAGERCFIDVDDCMDEAGRNERVQRVEVGVCVSLYIFIVLPHAAMPSKKRVLYIIIKDGRFAGRGVYCILHICLICNSPYIWVQLFSATHHVKFKAF